MKYRHIDRKITGTATVDGAGVHLVRVIGLNEVEEFDPFLMLDAFDSINPDDYIQGFPWHPHRGIETLTYLVHGNIEHGDSLGNNGHILDGGSQWMTAGSGIIHQEMPKATNRMLGIQLWINLPANKKMTDPKYRDLTVEKIPVVSGEGYRIAVIAGTYRDSESRITSGAMQGDSVNVTVLDIEIKAGRCCNITVPEQDTVFAYILDGSASFDADKDHTYIETRMAVHLTQGNTVSVSASDTENAHCILFSGTPLHEPVAWGGPIVMNTREELEHAFKELDAGTFIKHRK